MVVVVRVVVSLAGALAVVVGCGRGVAVVVVVITGVLGAVVSIVIANSSEGTDSFPATSVAVTVRL